MLKIKSGFTGERAIIIPAPVAEEWSKDKLGTLLRITDIGFYPKADSHFRARLATEAMQYILIYCVEGEGIVRVNQQEYSLQPNQLIIIPKGTKHSYGSKPGNPWTIYWIHFDGTLAGHFSEGLNKPKDISPAIDSRIEDRIQLFDEMYSTLRNGYSQANLSYCISVFFHFLGSLRYLGVFRENRATDNTETGLIEKSIHYMRENIHRRLTLAHIADYSGLSVSHFTALFQQKTGFPPISYFLQLKIQQACHYLDFTDMKINQISTSLGINDPLYFSRIFSKTMGVSPLIYRKKKKG
jgi:Transcriptional regulator containing an amidase domain and an AraC-type DNA-binding HTH domain